MTVNINAANITSIRLADQANAPTGVANNFINLYADTNGDIATVKGGGGGIKITTSPATGNYTLTVDGTGTAARLNASNVFTSAQVLPAGTVSAPALTTTGDTNTGIYFPGADRMAFATGGVIRGSWTTDGLCFGTDNAAANALGDYEEGNWTPAWAFAGGGSATSALAYGRYVKIGKVVYIKMRLATASLSTPTGPSGSVTITGLPFVSNNASNTSNRASLAVGEAYRFATAIPNIKANITDNSQVITLRKEATDATTDVTLQGSDFASIGNYNAISISGWYETP